MFDVAKKARLLPSDVAKLMRVSRITASQWFNNRARPHHLLLPRVTALLKAIEGAYDDGKLPVPHDIVQRERAMYLRNTLTHYIKAPKPPELG